MYSMLVHFVLYFVSLDAMDNQDEYTDASQAFIKNDTTLIEEPPDEVNFAMEPLKKLEDFGKTNAFVVDEVRVDPMFHPYIIGRKGTMLHRIQEETRSFIFFPNYLAKRAGKAVPPDVIHIKGTSAAVAAAKQTILQIVASKTQDRMTKTIKIDKIWHEKMIGERGKNLKKIHERFSAVQVNFPQLGSPSCDVSITGRAHQIERCAQYLEKLADDIAVTKYCEEVHLDRKFHAHVIGRGGCNLRKIREMTRTWIKVPDTLSDGERIAIFGLWKNVEKARRMIFDTVAMASSYVEGPKEDTKEASTVSTETVEEYLQPATRDLNSAIGEGVTKSEEVVLEKLTGDPRQVMSDLDVKAENWQIFKPAFLDFIPEDFYVNVPAEFHKHITGERGQSVRAKADKCGVALKVPHALMESDTILLRGPPTKCAEIKQALLLLVTDLAAREEARKRHGYRENIRLESEHYCALVVRQGKYSRKHSVCIEFYDGENVESGEIAIIGLEHRVKEAKADILSFLEEFDTRITDVVNIDRGVYSQIIGTKGRHVADLQHQFKVSIDFPKERQTDEVKISGQKANVETAKSYLLYLANCYTGAHAVKCKRYDQHRFGSGYFVARDEQHSVLHSPTTANESGATGTNGVNRKQPSRDLPSKPLKM